MPIILGAGSILNIMVWVDAVDAFHDDMRRQTGGAILFGPGVIMRKSAKQKLNTNILMDSEVVGVRDYIPDVVRTEIF